MDIFGGHRKTKLLFFGGKGLFFWYFLKVKVQIGNFFVCVAQIEIFLGRPDIPDIFEG